MRTRPSIKACAGRCKLPDRFSCKLTGLNGIESEMVQFVSNITKKHDLS